MAWDPSTSFTDLKEGCTGKINAGDLIVKGWATADEPRGLHLRCGKREWAKKVQIHDTLLLYGI